MDEKTYATLRILLDEARHRENLCECLHCFGVISWLKKLGFTRLRLAATWQYDDAASLLRVRKKEKYMDESAN